MRKLGVGLVGVIFGLMLFLGTAWAADKFGYCDLAKAFSDYKKAQDYDKSLTDKQTAYENEREKKLTDFKALQDKINLLSEKEKAAKQPELDTKIKAIQEFDRQKQVDLRKEQEEKMKEIVQDIESAIKKYSESQGYTMVFGASALVYQDKNLEITDKIIADLNKNYKGK